MQTLKSNFDPRNPAECPACHHPPISHVEDGTGITCMGCYAMGLLQAANEPDNDKQVFVCTKKFTFRLSKHEREQAARAPKDTFPGGVDGFGPECIECGAWWAQHTGMLCVTGDSTFIPLLDCGPRNLII